MVGTSLAMAPSFLVGQLCQVVDLDGPVFLSTDRGNTVRYVDGFISCEICRGVIRIMAMRIEPSLTPSRGDNSLFNQTKFVNLGALFFTPDKLKLINHQQLNCHPI